MGDAYDKVLRHRISEIASIHGVAIKEIIPVNSNNVFLDSKSEAKIAAHIGANVILFTLTYLFYSRP